jgi:hypothetical protein
MKKKAIYRILAAVVAVLGAGSAAQAGTAVWTNSDGNNAWSSNNNWGGAEPGAGDRAVIRLGGSDGATVTQAGENAGTIDIAWGNLSTTVGLLTIQSGDLTVNNTGVALQVGSPGTGTIAQSGGTFTVKGSSWLGAWDTNVSGGSGAYNMTGGTFTTNEITVGQRGTGSFDQSGSGSIVNVDTALYVGRGNSGSYTLSNGTLNLGTSYSSPNSALNIGYGTAASNQFTQSGGTVNANGKVLMGADATTVGYTMTGGLLHFTGINDLVVGGASGANATFLLGDAATTGQIDAAGSTNLYVGGTSGANAAFKGWGNVAVTYIYNNGNVTADGYGTDRTLDFSSGDRVFNSANSATSGWHAVDHGAIILPAVAFDTINGQPTQTWGGNKYDNAPTLVNSFSLTLPTTGNLSRSGDFVGTLLATDRGDIPSIGGDADLIGVWNVDLTLSPTTQSSDLTGSSIAFRYDDALAATLGLNESDLKVFQYVNGHWTELASSLDLPNHIISADTNSISMFAVGVGAVPEPGSLALLGGGVAGLLMRRRRRIS